MRSVGACHLPLGLAAHVILNVCGDDEILAARFPIEKVNGLVDGRERIEAGELRVHPCFGEKPSVIAICVIDGFDPTGQPLVAVHFEQELVELWRRVKETVLVVTRNGHAVPDNAADLRGIVGESKAVDWVDQVLDGALVVHEVESAPQLVGHVVNVQVNVGIPAENVDRVVLDAEQSVNLTDAVRVSGQMVIREEAADRFSSSSLISDEGLGAEIEHGAWTWKPALLKPDSDVGFKVMRGITHKKDSPKDSKGAPEC